MRQFFEAFAYFIESGLPEKLAKGFAEKITGVKAPSGKIKIPDTKTTGSIKLPENTKPDVITASDNVSPSYASGDTKYNADILAEELARKRGFIKDDGIQDSTDMDGAEYSKLYDEAYQYLTGLRANLKTVKRADIPKKLITKKERGEFNFINSKISDPQKSKLVLDGLDGTTEGLYNRFRLERDAIEKGMVKQIKEAQSNNLALGRKDMDNIIYNMKIFKNLDDKVKSLGVELSDAGKEPEKLYQMFKADMNNKSSTNQLADYMKSDIFDDFKGILGEMDTNMKKIKSTIDEIDEIKNFPDPKDRVKNLYQGKGYAQNEAINRSLARQFLADEIEAGTISVRPAIYNAMRDGGHPYIDAIKIFRHHYGDNAFDILGKYIDENAFSTSGIRYPGRFEFRKRGVVPKNKNAPGNTYSHYSLPGEIDQEIADVDLVIKSIEGGDNAFFKGAEDIKNQNIKRANLVKIKNEIAPSDSIDLSQYTNKSLNELSEEGNKLQSELSLVDQDGSSTLPYQEFQEKSLRLDEINKILKEAQTKPDDFFADDSAEIIPFNLKKSDDDPTKFARGGIVEVLI